MLLINLLKQLKSMNTLKEYEYCKRVGKNISTKIWSLLQKKNNNFNEVTRVGFVKISLKMRMKKLEIIIT